MKSQPKSTGAKRKVAKRRRVAKRKVAPTQAIALPLTLPEAIEQVLIGGDLAPLTAEQRLSYYKAVCKSIGVNPLTRPLEYIALNGRLTLYARKDCTDQLRRLYGVAVTSMEREQQDIFCIVKVWVRDRIGRTDAATGIVVTKGLATVDLANAMMKAETKAKRRATLSICGLGFLDESEVDTMDDYGILTPGGRLMTLDAAASAEGSKEAAQAVAQRKIAEAAAKENETAIERVAPKPTERQIIISRPPEHNGNFIVVTGMIDAPGLEQFFQVTDSKGFKTKQGEVPYRRVPSEYEKDLISLCERLKIEVGG